MTASRPLFARQTSNVNECLKYDEMAGAGGGSSCHSLEMELSLGISLIYKMNIKLPPTHSGV